MAKPNYAFAKRQRDLAKKQKKEEKRQRKTQAQQPQAHDELLQPSVETCKSSVTVPVSNTDTSESRRKAQIDALLLTLPGVSTRKINRLDGYFISDKMFACISGDGIGLRLPVAIATELQFSRDNVVPFQPGGMASSREWVQINRAKADEYEKDLPLFQSSLEFVKAARSR
jgi:hypothetical protein